MNELVELAIRKIRLRFEVKIDQDEYYLTYSGGNDSHVLMYLVKFVFGYDIPVVSVNTYREHKEIRRRMYQYSDIVLYPVMKMQEINEKYGMPCFTKFQDEIIGRYQRGSRAWYTMSIINGTGPGAGKFKLNNLARESLLSDQLHKVSNKCCDFTKKKPLKSFEKETGLKPILGIRSSESVNRSARYKRCLDDKGKFTPMFDITDEMIQAIINEFGIEVPDVYSVLERTGCIGCPYGRHIEDELNAVPENQRRYAIESFGKSYDLLGIEY